MQQTGIATPDTALRSLTMNRRRWARAQPFSTLGNTAAVPNQQWQQSISRSLFLSSLGVAALAGLTSAAPTANADPDPISVGAYLHTLNVLHVPYDNPGRMVDIGNNVCQQARGGTDFDTIYPTVAGNGYASVQAGQIMGAAVGTFCPDVEAAFDRWTNS